MLVATGITAELSRDPERLSLFHNIFRDRSSHSYVG